MQRFSHRVQAIVRQIPEGSTLTYGQVAALAGNPQAARAVGRIMAQNTDPTLPCHRVVRADGTIGGYNGVRTGSGGPEVKRALLAEEGVHLTKK
ncbi:MGMT family protein [Candidatus Peribacteria bacterium]|nr:MGMT family protein [Candidatus Peribacteria bacterium]